MSSPTFADKKYELLATAVTIVLASYSLRATFLLPAFGEMLAISEVELPLFTGLVFRHSGMVTVLVVVVAAITLWATWSRHRLGGLVVAVGIICLGIATQLLCSAAISPIIRMINTMGNQ